jgi:hypothetical protein
LQAINDLYANELHLFRNLFLPSVKLVRKVRVGSRTRRIYGMPQTPFARVCASPASDPERIAVLQRQQQELDPFQLSRAIQAKLEHIFQLSRELTMCGKTPAPLLQNTERQISKTKRKQRPTKNTTERNEEKCQSAKLTKKPRRVVSYVP